MRRSGSRAVIMTGKEQGFARMEGYMYKKNKHRSGMFSTGWSKRWVWINDERGRLHVCKKKGQEGSTVVRARTRSWLPFFFVLSMLRGHA